MEIAQGIHRIETPLADRFVCLFLLVGEECSLLIDTGLDSTPGEWLFPYMAANGLDPERIRHVLVSHADFDHFAGNVSVREAAPHARFMCHDLDRVMVEDIERLIWDRYGEFIADHGIDDGDAAREFIRSNARTVPMDLTLQGGETINLGGGWRVAVLHTPGHSRGHLSVYDARSRTAIICDATLYNAVLTSAGAPAFPPTYRYVDTYVSSMARFGGLEIEILLSGHYPTYRGQEVAEFLGESRAFVDRVDEVLMRELKPGGSDRTMKEIIAATSSVLGAWPEAASQALAFPLLGHLERLERRRLIEKVRRGDLAAYRTL
jgi:glyoxylase-like metal-dependent hydrolase (beta-lactamase superfamily II)